jgi:hypothetical protein
MMTNKYLLVIGLSAAGLVLACQSQAPAPPAESKPASPAAAPAAPVAIAPAVAPEPEIDLESLPAEEDFEEEAELKITSKNLEQELQQLEKELAAE